MYRYINKYIYIYIYIYIFWAMLNQAMESL